MANCFCAQSGVIFVFISGLRSNWRNEFQNKNQISTLTVRHDSTYIVLFLTRHNEPINDDHHTLIGSGYGLLPYDTKLSPGPMLSYCQLYPREQTSMRFASNVSFSFKKCIWKYCLYNIGHFVQVSICFLNVHVHVDDMVFTPYIRNIHFTWRQIFPHSCLQNKSRHSSIIIRNYVDSHQ